MEGLHVAQMLFIFIFYLFAKSATCYSKKTLIDSSIKYLQWHKLLF